MRSMTIVFKEPAAPLRYQPIPEATLPRVSEAADPANYTKAERNRRWFLLINYIRVFLAYKGHAVFASKQQKDALVKVTAPTHHH